MSDTARKMFPVETVLALAVAKKGADVKDIAGYITGRSIVCDACAAAVAPFAAAWLAKLSPKFLDMNYKDGDNWGDFVNQGARLLGDTISLTPMDDCLKNAVATVLDMMDDMHGTMVSQRAEIATLRQQVETLAPYQGKAEELQKKCDKLEDTIKTMKTDMGGLRRQVAEFQGKVAINHDELMQSIKDAIKDNLKNITVGVAAAGVAGEAAAGYGALYVELALGAGYFERLTANHLQGLETEVVVDGAVVDLDLTGAAREKTNAGNRGLSSAGAIEICLLRCIHQLILPYFSQFSGF